ncbi:MAG: hypothetical protein R8M38_02505 [Mariprofundaceae bacterium]
MDWQLLLYMAPLGVFCWWAGFVATKRMRVEKNKEREERAQRAREVKATMDTPSKEVL